ncbi:hypothetical protein ABZV29_41910 [Streptomyces sp. NPDC005236]|uniref:hypothetical protein n=1 Tax=Streptomyces sp. NPDC005236 TaxID=3157028 RepID=UPI00339F3B04
MAEPGTTTDSWAKRLKILKDATQQRLLSTPMPTAAMEQLLSDGKAHVLGAFEDSPVHYMGRWWRADEPGWVALDEAASTQLDVHAERYRGATAAIAASEAPHPRPEANAMPLSDRPEAGAG